MKLIEQIKEMMAIQDELNCQLNPDWRNQGWDFLLAAKIEMVEALEHYGWKWWKHQEPDIEQVKMEMADILHFLLSYAISKCYSAEVIANDLDDALAQQVISYENFNLRANNFISSSGMYFFYNFFRCLRPLEMNFEELRKLYLGKAILNKIRWNNGYNDGTYVKVWDGLEDNEYLTSILMCHPDVPADEIYRMLEERYRKIV